METEEPEVIAEEFNGEVSVDEPETPAEEEVKEEAPEVEDPKAILESLKAENEKIRLENEKTKNWRLIQKVFLNPQNPSANYR
jgi:regulator of replication initiation timing